MKLSKLIRTRISRRARRFFAEESGSTAMEYSLIAALIGVAIIASVSLVSQSNQDNFNTVDEALSSE